MLQLRLVRHPELAEEDLHREKCFRRDDCVNSPWRPPRQPTPTNLRNRYIVSSSEETLPAPRRNRRDDCHRLSQVSLAGLVVRSGPSVDLDSPRCRFQFRDAKTLWGWIIVAGLAKGGRDIVAPDGSRNWWEVIVSFSIGLLALLAHSNMSIACSTPLLRMTTARPQ